MRRFLFAALLAAAIAAPAHAQIIGQQQVTVAVNPAGVDGALSGNLAQLGVQALGVAVVGAYSAVATAGILLLINLFVPIRVAGAEEERGLDLAQHGEIAYQS